MKLRSEDIVKGIKGRDRGKQGKIQRVFVDKKMVLVENVNLVSRHMKAQPGVRQAGIIQKEMPINVSNVVLICPNCSQPSRIQYKKLADETKARVCKNCKEVIE